VKTKKEEAVSGQWSSSENYARRINKEGWKSSEDVISK
jgi:hypothetical protein